MPRACRRARSPGSNALSLPSIRRQLRARISDETGIVVAAIGDDNRGYIIDDLSGKFSPQEWAAKVISAYHSHQADRIVIETNMGGDMAEQTLRTVDRNVPVTRVHAKRGKLTRAEPIASLYEQGRVSHIGAFETLEDQLCAY